MTTPEALIIPAGKVDARLAEVLDGYRAEWGKLDPLFGETIDLLATLVLAGGKRVRPAMAYWGYVGAGGDHRCLRCRTWVRHSSYFKRLHCFTMT